MRQEFHLVIPAFFLAITCALGCATVKPVEPPPLDCCAPSKLHAQCLCGEGGSICIDQPLQYDCPQDIETVVK